jgi:E1A/CREB-binding protein
MCVFLQEEVDNIPLDSTDKDEIMESEFFYNRQAFLSLCQGNHYQFDTVRRAKHSSMMVLYHIHNPNAPAFMPSCTICHSELEEGEGYKCSICTNFDICHACHQSSQEVQSHPHKFVTRSSAADSSADDRKQRALLVQSWLFTIHL